MGPGLSSSPFVRIDLCVSARQGSKTCPRSVTLLSSEMVTFKEFCDDFLRLIEARDFGDPGSLPELDADAFSPGAKELRSTGVLAALHTPSLLQRFHRLSRECERLMKEQDAVRHTSHDASATITKLRQPVGTWSGKSATFSRTELAFLIGISQSRESKVPAKLCRNHNVSLAVARLSEVAHS